MRIEENWETGVRGMLRVGELSRQFSTAGSYHGRDYH